MNEGVTDRIENLLHRLEVKMIYRTMQSIKQHLKLAKDASFCLLQAGSIVFPVPVYKYTIAP